MKVYTTKTYTIDPEKAATYQRQIRRRKSILLFFSVTLSLAAWLYFLSYEGPALNQSALFIFTLVVTVFMVVLVRNAIRQQQDLGFSYSLSADLLTYNEVNKEPIHRHREQVTRIEEFPTYLLLHSEEDRPLVIPNVLSDYDELKKHLSKWAPIDNHKTPRHQRDIRMTNVAVVIAMIIILLARTLWISLLTTIIVLAINGFWLFSRKDSLTEKETSKRALISIITFLLLLSLLTHLVLG